MSRYTKAAPGGRCLVLDDGYQLCARCGSVHCTADTVVAVYRTPWWIIYTHLPGRGCLAKAVSGWRAVELALDSRELNVPTAREAYPVIISGFTLPFVSLLDNEHCTAEMAAVTISRKEFLPSQSSFSEGNDDDDDFLANVLERGGQRDWGSWQSWELGIVAVAVVRGRLAEITRDVLRQEQAPLHVKRSGPWSIVTLSEQDERLAHSVASSAVCGPLWRPRPQSKSRPRNANLESRREVH